LDSCRCSVVKWAFSLWCAAMSRWTLCALMCTWKTHISLTLGF
jgi:hypothetical protein